MKKRFILYVAVATLTLAMTACGSENVNVETEMNGRFEVIKDIEVTTPTAEPTKEAETTPTIEPTTEPTVEPTATSTPTPEPTATSTPEPTSTPTPEPTATSTPTPEPTSTPAPTEAPVVEEYNWEEILQKLHSLETYEEREAYIETLDKSKYEVAAVDNFDLIAVPNRVEFAGEDEWGEWDEYTKYTLLDSKYEGSYIENILNYDEYVCGTVGEYYLMTITELTTGQTDPWGISVHSTDIDMETWEEVETVITCTLETLVNNTYKVTDELNNERGDKYAYPKTWETKFYYE